MSISAISWIFFSKTGNPTDKNDVANKTKPKTNSANTIGAQVTIGFAVFLAVFNKVMA